MEVRQHVPPKYPPNSIEQTLQQQKLHPNIHCMEKEEKPNSPRLLLYHRGVSKGEGEE